MSGTTWRTSTAALICSLQLFVSLSSPVQFPSPAWSQSHVCREAAIDASASFPCMPFNFAHNFRCWHQSRISHFAHCCSSHSENPTRTLTSPHTNWWPYLCNNFISLLPQPFRSRTNPPPQTRAFVLPGNLPVLQTPMVPWSLYSRDPEPWNKNKFSVAATVLRQLSLSAINNTYPSTYLSRLYRCVLHS